MTQSVKATVAQVVVQLRITVLCNYSDDWTIKQAHEQVSREAVNRIHQLLSREYAHSEGRVVSVALVVGEAT